MYEFNRKSPLLIRVISPSGSVEIVAEEREHVTVKVEALDTSRQDREAAENTSVVLIGDELTIEPPKGSSYLRSSVRLKIEVKAPAGSSADIEVASSTATCIGQFNDLNVTSASGELQIGDASGNVRLKTSSGDVQLGDVGGRLSARSSSAKITAGEVLGLVNIRSSSGDVELDATASDVKHKSSSGTLRINRANAGTITSQTASGDVVVGVNKRAIAQLDVKSITGQVTTTVESESFADVKVQVRSKSGDIAISAV